MLKEKIKIKPWPFCHGQIPEAQGSGSVLSTRPLNCQSGEEHNRLKKPQQLGEDEVQSIRSQMAPNHQRQKLDKKGDWLYSGRYNNREHPTSEWLSSILKLFLGEINHLQVGWFTNRVVLQEGKVSISYLNRKCFSMGLASSRGIHSSILN